MGAASQIIHKVLQPINAPRGESDALLVESVLFHAFHACAGLWSENEDEPQYEFDPSLWRKAESYLSDSGDSSEASLNPQAPVLGVPLSLLQLAMQLRQLYRSPLSLTSEDIQKLQAEGLEWEKKVLFMWLDVAKVPISRPEDPSVSPDGARDECCEDITVLYVLAVSLLLDNMFDGRHPEQTAAFALPWQLKVAVEILRKHESDLRWQRSYMGNWPVYTLGAFAPNTGARECIQTDLRKRWTLTKLSQSKRFLDDLEMMWANAAPI